MFLFDTFRAINHFDRIYFVAFCMKNMYNYKSHIIANKRGESLSRSQTHSERFIVPNLNWGYRVCSQNHQLCIQKT